MNSKEFLLQECENVRATLRDVLRHDYSAGSSAEFYNEFCERLAFLEYLLKPTDSDDVSALATFAGELSLLSTIVHHMERSHAGEFPWPFTEYLQSLATPLCKENLAQNEGEPIIRVYAEGGLDSYQINLENDLSLRGMAAAHREDLRSHGPYQAGGARWRSRSSPRLTAVSRANSCGTKVLCLPSLGGISRPRRAFGWR